MIEPVFAKITEKHEVTPWAHLLWLEAPEIAAAARPGQFVMVRCGGDTLLRRPLSIHRTDGDKLALLFAVVGRGTAWLAERKAGDAIDIFGPLGNGYTIHPDAKNLLLVAGGMGIAPIRFLADSANKRGKNITLLMGAQRAVQLLSTELLPSKMKLVLSTDDGSMGNAGLATQSISHYENWADQIFACGPVGMYQTMAAMPELQGKSAQISLETRMACGLGLCYGCTVKTKSGPKQVCRDGPVFDLGEVLWSDLAASE